MENIMINESKKVDKFGVLNTNKNQVENITELNTKNTNTIEYISNELKAKDTIIQNLLKEVGKLTVKNSKLKAELEILHNETNNNGIEAEQATENFLSGNNKDYSMKKLEDAYKLENQMPVGY